MNPFSTIVIPYWIKDQLDESLQDPSELLDPTAIDSMLSAQDQAFLAGFQSLSFGAEADLFPTVGASTDGLLDAWGKTHDRVVGTKALDFVEDIDRYNTVAQQFSLYNLGDLGTVKFKVIDLNAGQVGVVIYPSFFTAQAQVDSLTQLELLREILEVWYKYFDYSQIYRTSLYRRYLELLRLEQAVA